jgi:syntaxin 1B/2/3
MIATQMPSYSNRGHDIESGQGQYGNYIPLHNRRESFLTQLTELQPRSAIAITLAKRREIEEKLNHVVSKQNELRPAQQALLDSTTSTEDHQCRLHIESIGSDIMGYFSVARNMLAELKREANPDDQRVQAQIQYISEKIRQDIEAYRISQSEFDRQMRSQVRRRYQIAREDATPEEIDQGVENVIMGQEQVFSVCFYLGEPGCH